MVKKNNKKNRVLVTGGSGFLGINLVRYLYKKNYDITVIDRVAFTYKDMNDKIRFVKGDIRNKTALETAMKDVDIVVHTAAALPLYKKEEIFSTDIKGTKNVMEIAKKVGIKKVIHISSTAVYGIPDHHPLYETDKMIGVGPYGIAKVKAEKVCELFREKGMIIPVIRPKSFMGPERLGVMGVFYDWIVRNKNIPLIGNGKNKYQLLHVLDLCDVIYLTMTLPDKKVNTTFNIGAKEFGTMASDVSAVLKHANNGKRVIPFPAKPLIAILRVLEFFHISPLYKWVYETACEDSFVSIEKAEKILGYKPKYSNAETLIDNYDWYMAHRTEFEGKTGVSHRLPWKQGALKIASWFF